MNVYRIWHWWQHLYLLCFLAAIAAMALGNGWLATGFFATGLISGWPSTPNPPPASPSYVADSWTTSQTRTAIMDDVLDYEPCPFCNGTGRRTRSDTDRFGGPMVT